MARSLDRPQRPSPPWRYPFIIAFTGIRGIVSLAAALAIPLTIADGSSFPHRDLILFITFSVVVVTLVGQGSLLPSVIRWLGLDEIGRAERRVEKTEELASRRLAIEAGMRRLDELAAERSLPERIVEPLRAHHRDRVQQLDYRIGAAELETQLARLSEELQLELIEAERKQLYTLLCSGGVKDDARRRIEHDLDLQEAQLRRSAAGGGGSD
jgi:NhaP-type Na+/H+ or K+/H+ antiporter